MRRTSVSTVLTIGGLMLLVGITFMPGPVGPPPPALAQTLPPRPTVSPTPITSPEPDEDVPPPPSAGRITGTVIDLTTGAPAPGIAVAVGDVIVTSDANGNYDRWLPPGSYLVALMLAAGQGTPAQGPITVELAPDATVVQHLAFRSPAAVSPTTAATATPVPPAAGGALPAAGIAPDTLPRTGGAPGDARVPLGLALGTLALLVGAGVGYVARRREGKI